MLFFFLVGSGMNLHDLAPLYFLLMSLGNFYSLDFVLLFSCSVPIRPGLDLSYRSVIMHSCSPV
jgi:hypothetical protein